MFVFKFFVFIVVIIIIIVFITVILLVEWPFHFLLCKALLITTVYEICFINILSLPYALTKCT